MHQLPSGRRTAIVLGLGVLVALSGCDAAVAPTSSPHRPPPAIPDPAPAWQRLDVGEVQFDPPFDSTFDEVVSGVAYGDGFVLVGRSEDEAGEPIGGVWSSPDGTAWLRAQDPDGVFDAVYLERVATDGTRLVALGWRTPWGNASRRGPYLAFVSDDGTTWTRHEVEATALGRIHAEGVVGSPSGFLAWGGGNDGRSALLRSDDGLDWQTVHYPGAGVDNIARIAPHGGGFLAVGGRHREDPVIGGPAQPGRAWWSPDGRQWAAAGVPAGWSLNGVYPAARGVFAIGTHECSRCVGPQLAWHSTDGRGWSKLGDAKWLHPFWASNGTQVAVFDWQGDRSVHLSEDGLNFRVAAAGIPRPEYDAGIIAGRTGILVLIADTPIGRDGVMDVHAGVQFLRGS